MRRARPALGTIVEVRIAGGSQASRTRAVEAAFEAIARTHALMSFHEVTSDVYTLNMKAGTNPIGIDQWTWDVLKIALDVWRLSDGLFDCTVAPLLVSADILPQHHSPARPVGGMHDIELLEGCRVRFRKPLQIDLGGIAKGYAVDKAVDAVLNVGPFSGVVNAGGDLRLFGEMPEPVYVRRPRSPGKLFFLGVFSDVSVATSAAYYSRRAGGGRPVSALADPRRGKLIDSDLSATVVAPDCVMADALTKPLILTGDESLPCFAKLSAHAHIVH